jgi:hypothetical protein
LTVMTWGNSEGIKGRCDAKCHNATCPHCDCMCGGRYHGTARNGTFDAVRIEQGKEILKAARARAQVEGWDFSNFAEVGQLSLFD